MTDPRPQQRAAAADRVTASTSIPGGAVTVGSYSAGGTTIDVGGGVTFVWVAQSAPTTITNLVNGTEGQVVTLAFADALTTITQANATLYNNTSFQSAASATLVLVRHGSLWYEVARDLYNGTTAPSPGGTTVTSGTTTLDFGTQGSQSASVAVVGQALIAAASSVSARIEAVATATNTADEHKMAPIVVTCSAPTAGVGFTIYGSCEWILTGEFSVAWSWS